VKPFYIGTLALLGVMASTAPGLSQVSVPPSAKSAATTPAAPGVIVPAPLMLENLDPTVGIAKACTVGAPIFRVRAIVENTSTGADPQPLGVAYAMDDKKQFVGATTVKALKKNQPTAIPIYIKATKENLGAVPGAHRLLVIVGPNSRTIDFTVQPGQCKPA
jgi:hypothetical protein